MTNEDKKPRKMTAKGWLAKAGGKVSAAAFLQASREFLLTGNLAEATTPIISRVDTEGLLPSPALELLRVAVMNHLLNESAEATDKAASRGEKKDLPYLAKILDGEGNVAIGQNEAGEDIDLVRSFAMAQEGERWIDRRMVDGSPDWRGEVIATHMIGVNGPITTHVTREESLKRQLRSKAGPVSKTMGKSQGKLSFGATCHPDRSVFSRG